MIKANLKSPLDSLEILIKEGTLYIYCISCHGSAGMEGN
jgi:hypothetical protein